MQRPTIDGPEGSGRITDNLDYRNLVHETATRRHNGRSSSGGGGGSSSSSSRRRRSSSSSSSVWPGYLSPQQVRHVVEENSRQFGQKLQMPLAGLKRVERFVDVASLMSLRYAAACVEDLSDATIAAASMDATVRFSVADKALQLATELLLSTAPALRWMCAGVYYVVRSYLAPIFTNIVSHGAFAMLRPGAPLAPFVKHVETVFLTLLGDELRKASCSCFAALFSCSLLCLALLVPMSPLPSASLYVVLCLPTLR